MRGADLKRKPNLITTLLTYMIHTQITLIVDDNTFIVAIILIDRSVIRYHEQVSVSDKIGT